MIAPERYVAEDFAIELEAVVPNLGIWASSGWSSVNPLPLTTCGVAGVVGPPFAAPDALLSLDFDIDGTPFRDHAHPDTGEQHLLSKGGRWLPGEVRRSATIHRHLGAKLVSLQITSSLVPLRSVCGYVLELRVRNRAETGVELSVRAQLDPGGPRRVAAGGWHYDPPSPGRRARPAGAGRWANDEAGVRLVADLASGPLGPGDTALSRLLVTVGEPEAAAPVLGDEPAAATTRWWERVVTERLAELPTLATSDGRIDAYYRRSLMSGLVCLWDSPAFATRPFVATGGLDGGTMCGYIWDIGGYAPNALTMMLGPHTAELVQLLAGIDLERHYAVTLDGSGVGVAYAYSPWSLVSLVRALATHRGVGAGVVEQALEVVEHAEARHRAEGDLLDYGGHQNLLEMRTAGWEHVVASPNAERAWCLETLAGLGERFGAAVDPAALRLRAAAIREALRRELWDGEAGWFRCRHPDGHSELVHSVQAFDALRAGACTPAMAEALFARVRPGDFLASHGVSSVSPLDQVHYEIGDPDWSGSGAYEGEATTLALVLYEQRRPDLAWETLRRLLWMGDHLPYFPQEHYCHRPDVPAHKRMNVIAGLAGAEALLFGLFGFRLDLDGTVAADPKPPPGVELELRGARLRGREVDVDLAGDRLSVRVDGRSVHDGATGPVLLVEP